MLPKDIRIKTIQLPFTENQQRIDDWKISDRNVLAIQSAIIRGDPTVTLYNWTSITPGIWDLVQRNLENVERIDIQRFNIFGPSGPNDPQNLLAGDARDAIGFEKWAGLRFQFEKVLATGGHGYVSLWNILFDDNSSRKVVIKKALSSAFVPEKESAFHLRYSRADHTTQIIDLNYEAKLVHKKMRETDPLAESKIRKGTEWNATNLRCVVFEYAPYGDVYRLMEEVGQKKAQFTNQVLWGIWECFVLGVATVAYTPSLTHARTSFERELDKAKANDNLRGFLDYVTNSWNIEHDVHLDMEALNVLVGTAPSHPQQPTFKMHDLGAWSFKMTSLWKTLREKDIWRMRGPVKIHGLTPEQISREWDDLPLSLNRTKTRELFAGEDFSKGNICAGRFGVWTNIFLIARVMESMMTGVFARYPFECGPHRNKHGAIATQTYGWQLMGPEYSQIDEELRDMVCRCLNERPADRPSVVQLIWETEKRKARGFGEPPEATHRWWHGLLHPGEELPLPPQRKEKISPIQQAVADRLGPANLIKRVIRDPAARVQKMFRGEDMFRRKQPTKQVVPNPTGSRRRRARKRNQDDSAASSRRSEGLTRPIRTTREADKLVEESVRIPRLANPGFLRQRGRGRVVDSDAPTFSAAAHDSISPPAFLAATRLGRTGNLLLQENTAVPSNSGSKESGRLPPTAALPYPDSRDVFHGDVIPDYQRPLQAAPLVHDAKPLPAGDNPYNQQQPALGLDALWPPTHAHADARINPANREPIKRKPVKSPEFRSININRVTQSSVKHVKFNTAPRAVVTSKVSKQPAKDKKNTGRGAAPKKSRALEMWIERAIPVMPVAVQNLVTRVKDLDVQLRAGDVPVYAYIK
ncbi:hypothetical protein FHETE_10185 [Fusarium heterosporum]|uniref:Protein kinase domain-containing protein n=1 Tax=Fusarium heterosporum TaxID=42747 RepID=A0A8H5SVU9_FUSHE|nr:hypothetical protein FHETE_10185 [Fusarium heterosporum]